MGKILISLVLCLNILFCAELVYPNTVKSVYLDESKSKVAGRLLPTNGIEILSKNTNLVKFRIKGYQNPGVSNVIYAKNGERILALAFAKTAKPEIKIIKKGENSSWNEVSVVAFTTDGDFENSVEPMFAKAKQLYSDNCSMCHTLHDVNHYNANQWPSLFNAMVARTPIEKADHWLVIEYLQKHTNKK